MLNNRIVVAGAHATSLDVMAEVFSRQDWLRLYLGTRRSAPSLQGSGVAKSNLVLGALRSANERWTLSTDRRLERRYQLMPAFDRWVRKHLQPRDWLFSSFGFVLDSFRDARARGGRTVIDGGNSHPENFWRLVNEEYERWGWKGDPIPRRHHERVLAMLEETDYILCPSGFVRDSYIARGFDPSRLPVTAYSVRLDAFKPPARPRPPRPFRVLCTGDCCLRKGTPYLLEAFAQLQREKVPVEFVLSDRVLDEVKRLVAPHRDRITWYSSMPFAQLPALLASCHAFVLPSLEEGLARAGLEAMSSGLAVISTPNTGLADYIRNGENGLIVPIRDGAAIAGAIRQLAENPDQATALGAAGRKSISKLSPESYAQGLVSAVQSLAQKEPSHS